MMYDDGIQHARLLCELVANNENLNLSAVADAMDLDLGEVNELLDRAHHLWETTKRYEVDHLSRVMQVVQTCAAMDSHMGMADVAAEMRVLANRLAPSDDTPSDDIVGVRA